MQYDAQRTPIKEWEEWSNAVCCGMLLANACCRALAQQELFHCHCFAAGAGALKLSKHTRAPFSTGGRMKNTILLAPSFPPPQRRVVLGRVCVCFFVDPCFRFSKLFLTLLNFACTVPYWPCEVRCFFFSFTSLHTLTHYTHTNEAAPMGRNRCALSHSLCRTNGALFLFL